MISWLIPEHFADILPREARVLESMRRKCLDLFKVHGFELVQPPMVEYVDSLLTGSGAIWITAHSNSWIRGRGAQSASVPT